MSSQERFIAQYRANMAAARDEHTEPTSRRRMVALTAAFTPMGATAALPITTLVVLISWIVANKTALWAGIAMIVLATVGFGYFVARKAVSADEAPAANGWRRWLPLAATLVIVVQCMAEMLSGGRVPTDPVVVLWFASIAWVIGFFPLATGRWWPARRAFWAVGPLMMFLVIVFIWTHAFFWLRFRQAVPELDAVAARVASGDRTVNGTRAGGFKVHYATRGNIWGNEVCDVGFWITGWHDDDTRYIVHCVGQPDGDFSHLEGDWWELEGKQRPEDL